MEQNIFNGLKNDKLTHISDVESGLKCGCICPSCKGKLVARKGKIKIHHFAHLDKDCGKAGETILHLRCKDIIQETKTFMLPIVNAPWFYDNVYSYGIHGFRYSNAMLLKVENVYAEKKIKNFIPDLILEVKGKKLLVEIVVTSDISEEKLEKIKNLGIATVKVNLKHKKWRDISDKELRRILCEDAGDKILGKGMRSYRLKEWAYNKYNDDEGDALKSLFRRKAKNKTVELSVFDSANPKTGEVIKEKQRFWFVNDCPKDKADIRYWKGGKYKGKKYVKLAYCLNCIWNVTEELEVKRDDEGEILVDNRRKFYRPNKQIKCIGHAFEPYGKLYTKSGEDRPLNEILK